MAADCTSSSRCSVRISVKSFFSPSWWGVRADVINFTAEKKSQAPPRSSTPLSPPVCFNKQIRFRDAHLLLFLYLSRTRSRTHARTHRRKHMWFNNCTCLEAFHGEMWPEVKKRKQTADLVKICLTKQQNVDKNNYNETTVHKGFLFYKWDVKSSSLNV